MLVLQEPENFIDEGFAVDGSGGGMSPEPVRFSNKVNASVLPSSLPNPIDLEVDKNQTVSETQTEPKQRSPFIILWVVLIAVFASSFLAK